MRVTATKASGSGQPVDVVCVVPDYSDYTHSGFASLATKGDDVVLKAGDVFTGRFLAGTSFYCTESVSASTGTAETLTLSVSADVYPPAYCDGYGCYASLLPTDEVLSVSDSDAIVFTVAQGLASTGSSDLSQTGVGTGLIVVGAALVLLTVRRRPA